MRSDVVKGRGYGAVAVAALFVLLLYGCARPQGTVVTASIQPSASPVAARAPLTIANPAFHSGEVGVTYAPVKLSATGGLPPYTWSSIGPVPAGLTLWVGNTRRTAMAIQLPPNHAPRQHSRLFQRLEAPLR